MCANCGEGKPTQPAKDSQRDTMHITYTLHDNNVTQFTVKLQSTNNKQNIQYE